MNRLPQHIFLQIRHANDQQVYEKMFRITRLWRNLSPHMLLMPGEGNHSGILAWRIPWTEEPGRLESMGLQRAGHH